jgi:hypothetical protein
MAIDKITCCKDCENRQPGCHGTCEKYLTQRAELDAVKVAQRKKNNINQGLNEFRYDGINKVMAKRNYRSKFRRGH